MVSYGDKQFGKQGKHLKRKCWWKTTSQNMYTSYSCPKTIPRQSKALPGYFNAKHLSDHPRIKPRTSPNHSRTIPKHSQLLHGRWCPVQRVGFPNQFCQQENVNGHRWLVATILQLESESWHLQVSYNDVGQGHGSNTCWVRRHLSSQPFPLLAPVIYRCSAFPCVFIFVFPSGVDDVFSVYSQTSNILLWPFFSVSRERPPASY